MIKAAMLDKLNDQLAKEANSAYIYYSMVGYFESVNLKGFANWMLIQAQEEITHMHRLFNYINDRGAQSVLSKIDQPKHSWDSVEACIAETLAHEQMISESINECMTLAMKGNDHSTTTMLQWFVAEQVEEEANADDLLQKVKMIGDNSGGLYLLDNELSKRTFVDETAK